MENATLLAAVAIHATVVGIAFAFLITYALNAQLKSAELKEQVIEQADKINDVPLMAFVTPDLRDIELAKTPEGRQEARSKLRSLMMGTPDSRVASETRSPLLILQWLSLLAGRYPMPEMFVVANGHVSQDPGNRPRLEFQSIEQVQKWLDDLKPILETTGWLRRTQWEKTGRAMEQWDEQEVIRRQARLMEAQRMLAGTTDADLAEAFRQRFEIEMARMVDQHIGRSRASFESLMDAFVQADTVYRNTRRAVVRAIGIQRRQPTRGKLLSLVVALATFFVVFVAYPVATVYLPPLPKLPCTLNGVVPFGFYVLALGLTVYQVARFR